MPVLERESGLAAGTDFHVGYAPERMNPGDPEHGLDRITRVVAGQTPEIAARLAALYGRINGGNVFVARDIRTAEAAKVIENAQRDINIAFINEVAQIFCSLGLSTHDVLDAARTKWNFLDFRPGLVGGHCIGVDPYYLANRAAEIGHDPEIILAGRRTNDAMGAFIVEQIARRLEAPNGPVLVLGITFKENISDVRNSQVPGMVAALEARGIETDVHDPLADAAEVERRVGIRLLPQLEGAGPVRLRAGGRGPRALPGARRGDTRRPARAGRPRRRHQEHVAGGRTGGRAQALDAVRRRYGAYRWKSRSIEAGSSAKSSITASAPRSCGGVGL